MVSSVINLPVEKIIVDEPNRLKRDIAQNGVLVELKSNIQQYGVKVPLLVTEYDDGSYHLVDGYRRLQVAIELEYKEVTCVITDRENISEIALSVNLHREDLTAVEIGKILQKVYIKRKDENPKFKYSQLSTMVNKSKAFISQHIGYIEKLSEEIQTDIIDNKRMIDKNILTRICKLDGEEQVDIYNQVVKDSLSREAVKKLIDELNKEEDIQDTDSEKSSVNISDNESNDISCSKLITIISTNTLELKIDKNAISDIKRLEMDLEMLLQQYGLLGEV